MSVPPIIGYIVLAGLAVGLLSPLALTTIGQRDRPGAMAGLFFGMLLSIPAGLLTGIICWSMFEEATAMPDGLVIFVGPLIGCFLGTLVVACLTREVGAGIAAMRKQRSERSAN